MHRGLPGQETPPPKPTRMSWMEMTEHGKAMADVTFTITESTPSGNSYLKYWGERPISAVVAVLSSLG